MLFQNLLLVLPAAFLASAAPADVDSLAADPGPPPAADSAAGAVSDSVKDVVVATALAASPCSDWVKLYGKGGQTYVEAQWCFRQEARRTVVTQAQRNPRYYWRHTWYPGGLHELEWRTKGKVEETRNTVRKTWNFDSDVHSDAGPVKKDIYTFENKIQSGDHSVDVHYYQKGPYLGADKAIDADVKFSISLGK